LYTPFSFVVPVAFWPFLSMRRKDVPMKVKDFFAVGCDDGQGVQAV
jgi:hypothetical protein